MSDKSCGTLLDIPKEVVDTWLSGWQEYLLLVINLTFTIIGIFANSFGLLFFIKKQRKDITTILFIALCIVDLATVLTLGPLQMLINVSAINFFDFSTGNFILFSIFSALSNFEIRFSMFLFMVMSFCRCLSVMSPFRRLNKNLVLTALLVYVVLLLVLCFYPVVVCNDLSYTIVPFTRMGQSEFLSTMNSSDIRTVHWVYLIVMEPITMFLPVIPIAITSFITSANLVMSSSLKSTNARSSRDGAITILILTFSTLMCFTPRLAISISAIPAISEHTVADFVIDGFLQGQDMEECDPKLIRWPCFILYLMTTGLSIANSGINPCIFLARGQNMKTYLKKSVRGAYKKSTGVLTRGQTSVTLTSVLANKSLSRDDTHLSLTTPFSRQTTSIALTPIRKQDTSLVLNNKNSGPGTPEFDSSCEKSAVDSKL